MDEALLDEAQLDVKDIHVFYGSIEAVKGMSFHVNQGEIVCLIGANGAGKTTTLRTVSGLLTRARGRSSTKGSGSTWCRPMRSWPWGWPSRRRGGASSRA